MSYPMQIYPVSNSNAVHTSPTTRTAPTTKPSGSSTPEDTVHLSKTAQAQISGDVDHDGDSH